MAEFKIRDFIISICIVLSVIFAYGILSLVLDIQSGTAPVSKITPSLKDRLTGGSNNEIEITIFVSQWYNSSYGMEPARTHFQNKYDMHNTKIDELKISGFVKEKHVNSLACYYWVEKIE